MADATVMGQIGLAVSVFGTGGGLWMALRNARLKAEEAAENREQARRESNVTRDERLESLGRERDEKILSEVRQNRENIGRHRESSEARFAKLEVATTDFMPRKEIEDRFEHLRTNRMQAEGQIVRQVEALSSEVRGVVIEVARLGENHKGTTAVLDEVKVLLKEQAADIARRFDKLSDDFGPRTTRRRGTGE